MEIDPPRTQIHLQASVTTGRPPALTLIAPGTHGMVEGVHGTGVGVGTPMAAAVAAAVAEIKAGLAGLWHMPKGAMFAPGAQSVITAKGIDEPVMGLAAVSVLGLKPIVHVSIAPLVTGLPIALPSHSVSTRLNLARQP